MTGRSYAGEVRPLRAILVYLIFVLLGGALLAPWLYELVQWLGSHSPWLHRLAENPFHRFVHRALLGLALLGLWPLLRHLGMRSWKDLGWVRPAGQWGRLSLGFLLGWISLATVAALAFMAGARGSDWAQPFYFYARFLAKTLVTALVVAVVEETLFRGALFGALRRALPWPVALVISSFLYAWVHFFQRPVPPAQIGWTTGLVQLAEMMRGFTDLNAMVPAFLCLWLAGVLLAWAYQRTGNLFWSTGLHTGWVFWLKAYSSITHPVGSNHLWLWGNDKLIDGWLACVMLGVAGVGVWFLQRPQQVQAQ